MSSQPSRISLKLIVCRFTSLQERKFTKEMSTSRSTLSCVACLIVAISLSTSDSYSATKSCQAGRITSEELRKKIVTAASTIELEGMKPSALDRVSKQLSKLKHSDYDTLHKAFASIDADRRHVDGDQAAKIYVAGVLLVTLRHHELNDVELHRLRSIFLETGLHENDRTWPWKEINGKWQLQPFTVHRFGAMDTRLTPLLPTP